MTASTIAQLLECEDKYQVTFDNLDEAAACLDAHYARFNYLTIVEQLAEFDQQHDVGFDAYTTTVWVDGHSFNMQWRPERETDHSEFAVERELTERGNYKRALHHRISLPFRLQGQGLVKPLLAAFHNQYRTAGVDEVKLVAGKFTGGYFWAKLGFHAIEEQAVRNILAGGQLKDISYESLQVWHAIVNNFYEQNPPESPFPMVLLSNEPYGKTLLKGTCWTGVMDLHNPEHFRIFENCLQLWDV